MVKHTLAGRDLQLYPVSDSQFDMKEKEKILILIKIGPEAGAR
jgi:hypothetical protein